VLKSGPNSQNDQVRAAEPSQQLADARRSRGTGWGCGGKVTHDDSSPNERLKSAVVDVRRGSQCVTLSFDLELFFLV